jgi:crotonobetainyl-CoA:carnitine CoA-transferase CaiB-like acyl-CoA transferase
VRTLAEAIRDPQFAARGVIHRHRSAAGIDGAFDVPLAAFKFAHGGPSIETPPPELGADTDSVLAEHGYDADQIAAFRREKVI